MVGKRQSTGVGEHVLDLVCDTWRAAAFLILTRHALACERSCDCSNSPLGLAIQWWQVSMITLAAAGCALAFLVAVLALGALSSRSGICSVYAYSTCSALMTFAYGTIGAAFILIGLLVTFEFKYESFALINDCRGLHISNSDATDPTAACTADAVCDVVAYLKLRMQMLGFGLGVPFFLCGFMMFISCWFCCCCKSAFIVDSPEEVDFRDDIKADMLLPNGKGEVPKSSPEPLITERRSDLLEKNENVTDDDLSLSLKPTVAEFNDDQSDRKSRWACALHAAEATHQSKVDTLEQQLKDAGEKCERLEQAQKGLKEQNEEYEKKRQDAAAERDNMEWLLIHVSLSRPLLGGWTVNNCA